MPVRLGTLSAWCSQRLTLVTVLLRSLENLCISRYRWGSLGSTAICSDQITSSAPLSSSHKAWHNWAQKQQLTVMCVSLSCCKCNVQMLWGLQMIIFHLFTPYVLTECVVGIAERSSSNVGRRSWSITDLHWKVLLFLQQNFMQSPKSELFSQVWSQSKFTLSAVWRKCSEAPMTRHLYFLTFPSLGPNKTKMY